MRKAKFFIILAAMTQLLTITAHARVVNDEEAKTLLRPLIEEAVAKNFVTGAKVTDLEVGGSHKAYRKLFFGKGISNLPLGDAARVTVEQLKNVGNFMKDLVPLGERDAVYAFYTVEIDKKTYPVVSKFIIYTPNRNDAPANATEVLTEDSRRIKIAPDLSFGAETQIRGTANRANYVYRMGHLPGERTERSPAGTASVDRSTAAAR